MKLPLLRWWVLGLLCFSTIINYVDRQALARYAINIEDVQDLIEMAIGGKAVSVKFEGDRQFDIAARYTPDARVDASAIGDILVHAPGGERVPLSQLKGATPTSAAMRLRSSRPSWGRSPGRVRATTGPTPGALRRRSPRCSAGPPGRSGRAAD